MDDNNANTIVSSFIWSHIGKPFDSTVSGAQKDKVFHERLGRLQSDDGSGRFGHRFGNVRTLFVSCFTDGYVHVYIYVKHKVVVAILSRMIPFHEPKKYIYIFFPSSHAQILVSLYILYLHPQVPKLDSAFSCSDFSQ